MSGGKQIPDEWIEEEIVCLSAPLPRVYFYGEGMAALLRRETEIAEIRRAEVDTL